MRLPYAWLLVSATAAASPDLRVHELPAPRHLHMRTADARPAPVAAPTPTVRRAGDPERAPLSERLIVRVDAGLAVDGARRSDKGKTLDGQMIDSTMYDSVRSYGLGQLYLGSRGIGGASVSTYFAQQLQLGDASQQIGPVAAVDQGSVTYNHAAWLESDGAFHSKWLKPLRLRAGRLYMYSPTIVHLDGLVLAWDNRWLAVSAYTGRRVPEYNALNVDLRGDVVVGYDMRVDLHRFHIPLFIDAATMRYGGSGGHTHSDLAGYVEPRRDMVVRSSTRLEDGRLARQRLEFRARVSEDSTIMVDSQLRTVADWFWDFQSRAAALNDDSSVGTGDIDAAARSYLDLGPVRPRFQTAVQAGTVLQQNVDLLARGAVALDVDSAHPLNSHLPEYVEGGAGVEIRLRRAFAVQSTALVRDYRRPSPGNLVDVAGTPDQLPSDDKLGEESLVEGGFSVRYSLGARRFSAQGELYMRRTRYAPIYLAPDQSRPEEVSFDGGGRFLVDAWVSRTIQLRGEYDVTSTLDESPELRGLKALRLWIEGTY